MMMAQCLIKLDTYTNKYNWQISEITHKYRHMLSHCAVDTGWCVLQRE